MRCSGRAASAPRPATPQPGRVSRAGRSRRGDDWRSCSRSSSTSRRSTLPDSGRFVARLIGSNAVATPWRLVEAAASPIAEPFSPGETALLAALAPLAGGSPRAVKRFLNAYRVARGAGPPRSAVALMLAIRLGGDRAATAAMVEALAETGPYLAEPAGPPALAAATGAAHAANDSAITAADAREAWEVALRYSLPD